MDKPPSLRGALGDAAILKRMNFEERLIRQEIVGDNWMELNDRQSARLFKILKMRRQGIPLQYILHKSWFGELELIQYKGVFIPRPESEMFIELAIQEKLLKPNSNVLDLCCGGGAIGLSLLHLQPSIYLTLLDKSKRAITNAAVNVSKFAQSHPACSAGSPENERSEFYWVPAGSPENERSEFYWDSVAKLQDPGKKVRAGSCDFPKGKTQDDLRLKYFENRVDIIQADAASFSSNRKFDLIVCNPPYIPPNLKVENEASFDPPLALYSADNGMHLAKQILHNSRTLLAKGGRILMEHFESNQPALIAFAESLGFSDVKGHADLNNRPRLIEACI